MTVHKNDVIWADHFSNILIGDILTYGGYTSQTITSGAASQSTGLFGRGGRNALRIHIENTSSISYYNSLTKTMPGVSDTCIFTVAFRYSAAQSSLDLPIFQIMNNANAQVSLVLNRDGTIGVYRDNFPGQVLLGTAPAVLSAGNFTVIGGRVKIHPTSGTVDLWFNGNPTPSFTLSGVGTSITGTSVWTAFSLGVRWTSNIFSPGVSIADWDYCDLVVKDDSLALAGGTAASDPIGEVDVLYLSGVTGNGNYHDGTPSSGSNHGDMIKEALPDGDSTFNEIGPTLGQRESYLNESLPAPDSTILAVISDDIVRKDSTGTAGITPFVRSAGVDTDSDVTYALTDTYQRYRAVYTDFGGVTISTALVNAMELGVKTA